jgi:hypothetical protein
MSIYIQAIIIVAVIYMVLGIYGIIEMFMCKAIWTDDFKKAMSNKAFATVILYVLSYPIVITNRMINS